MSLCECGCGRDAGTYPRKWKHLGVLKGDPRKRLPEHTWRRGDPMFRIEGNCLIWQWATNQHGYGIYRGEEEGLAHRVVYKRMRGTLPLKHHLHHLCKNILCCNPEHLEPITNGSHRRKHAKLTEADIATIKRSLEDTLVLAQRYGIAPEYVWHIRGSVRALRRNALNRL